MHQISEPEFRHIDPVFSAVDETELAIRSRRNDHWIIAYSGGKDSSATLKIFLAAAKRLGAEFPKTTVIYCDTGVENGILDTYVKATLSRMEQEFLREGWPVDVRVLKAPLHDRFFVKIIGRGYPPPTNSFRWCTKGLRISPVSEFIQSNSATETVLVLGLRNSESQQRDRSLKSRQGSKWQKQVEGRGAYDVFMPIADMGVPEVWDTIYALRHPVTIEARSLEDLYRDASGECPVIRAPQAPPCASGRFGCWTCTVVRKDRSAQKLVAAGYKELFPFLQFRDWLASYRNDPANRWPTRRNGREGLGPFTLSARKEILRRVRELENVTGKEIISPDEMGVIVSLWSFDAVARLSNPQPRAPTQ